MARFATIDDYLGELTGPLREIGLQARVAIDAGLPDASSAIRWAHPTWSLGKDPICYLKAASRHLTFRFWRGAAITDPSGRLESRGQVMAHTKLRSLEDVDFDLFASWLTQARHLHQTGLPVHPG